MLKTDEEEAADREAEAEHWRNYEKQPGCKGFFVAILLVVIAVPSYFLFA